MNRNKSILFFVGLAAALIFVGIPTASAVNCVVLDDSDFVSADGGCKDVATGLVWSAGGCQGQTFCYTWPQADSYCESLADGGFSDWRNPSANEMSDACTNGAGSHVQHEPRTMWTSTKQGKKFRKVGQFNAGCTISSILEEDSTVAVICVRETGSGNNGGGNCNGNNPNCP